jgi:hypothetical protein
VCVWNPHLEKCVCVRERERGEIKIGHDFIV